MATTSPPRPVCVHAWAEPAATRLHRGEESPPEFALLLAGEKGWANVVPGLTFITLAYALGRGVRSRRLHAIVLERRTEELEHEREALARQAVAAERNRIAHELHDVIAHSVTVMVVQAGAAERLLERDEQGTRVALESIREAGSEALDELRRLLGLLRDSATAGPSTEPQPGLGRLDALIEQAHASGLTVACVVDGTPRPLPPGIDVAAYRIVQEALTNVRKHAGPASASVRLGFSLRELDVWVSDDGNGGEPTAGDPGHGLIGMRERVALYGGSFACGPGATGGFEIRARIPLQPAAP